MQVLFLRRSKIRALFAQIKPDAPAPQPLLDEFRAWRIKRKKFCKVCFGLAVAILVFTPILRFYGAFTEAKRQRNNMKTKSFLFEMPAATGLAAALLLGFTAALPTALAYPPGVGILSNKKNCLECHANNGPWKDDQRTIIDLLDKDTMKSLKQADGSFLIETKRGASKTLLTVIGRAKSDTMEAPYRNAWLYLDPKTIGSASLSKFAPGWDVNLPMSCRIVGDTLDPYEGATLTVLPMTIRPTDAAQDAELALQVMLTKGESVKAKPKEGMIGSYFERKVKLKVID